MTKTYLGRLCGFGLNEDKKPTVFYAVSGRSEPSQKRKAVMEGNKVKIEPLDQLTPEQEKMKDLIIYNSMVLADCWAVVSNGKQTDDIYEMSANGFLRPADMKNYVRKGLEKYGPEPDSLKTPRIAAICDNLIGGSMGIITIPENAFVEEIHFSGKGNGFYITTYDGDFDNPKPSVKASLFDGLYPIKLRGTRPQELAEYLFQWMESKGKDLTVATAVAVYNKDWEVGLKNKHK